MKNFLSSLYGIITVGLIIGIVAATLQYLGNPGNMGICVACFERDIAGSIGFHRAGVVQYIRPEIIGILLGAFIISFFKKEFNPRGGSSTIIRFFLGVFAMIGALVFLGCPWRGLLRLAGGDLNAILGIAGLITGIAGGSFFLKKGFSLGRSQPQKNKLGGYMMPIFMVVLLLFLVFDFSKIMLSSKGPGSMHAPILISLGAGLLVGFLAQRSRFCTMGAIRDLILVKDTHLISGVISLVVSATVLNIILGQFNIGFEGQPIAHSLHVWNFLGMVLSGLAFSLAGGCPGRQLILTGEGDTDSGVFVMGMFVGASFAHNFSLASSPKGLGEFGAIATIIGIIFCVAVGFFMIEERGK
ncbi:MAG: YedE-related selenium metabolism membrane protein [Candidatus Cloacimonadota bacterium]|nr:MAG: YedE-related selenium metabolism membrane protein [Candidatus Cloacimonadota bacterium]PIE78073.1 MAG: YedE-related selenium metabolism membrane protein [Candidatus Delongbacteria bacterium]